MGSEFLEALETGLIYKSIKELKFLNNNFSMKNLILQKAQSNLTFITPLE